MKYEVVITPGFIEKDAKGEFPHVCTPIIITDRSYDVAMELVEGIENVLKKRFSCRELESVPDICSVLVKKFEFSKNGSKGFVIVKIKKAGKECPPAEGNVCSVFEFERDIECIVDEVEECLER